MEEVGKYVGVWGYVREGAGKYVIKVWGNVGKYVGGVGSVLRCKEVWGVWESMGSIPTPNQPTNHIF